MAITMPETTSVDMGGSSKKKMDELNGSMLDLQSQMEKRELEIKGVRNDLDSIKGEMGHISESIKKMLCIYEEVSRQYNPFVQEGNPSPMPQAPGDESMDRVVGVFPYDDELDHVITPDDLEEKPKEAAGPAERPVEQPELPILEPKPKAAPPMAPFPGLTAPERSLSDSFIASCMTQISKIIEMKSEKENMDQAIERIYLARLNGTEPSADDAAMVENWYAKMRR